MTGPTDGVDSEHEWRIESDDLHPPGAAKMTAAQTLALLRQHCPDSYYLTPTTKE